MKLNGSKTKMEVRYLGTNTLVFNKGNSVLMIDPHFSRPGLARLLFGLQANPRRIEEGLRMANVSHLAAVLLTHTHYDHALDLPEAVQVAGGQVFGSESARMILLGSGLPDESFHPVNPREAYRIGAFTVRFHPARHIPFRMPLRWLLPESGRITRPLKPPVPFWNYRCGDVYAIQVDDSLVFGSAGFETDTYAGLEVNSVILGIGGLETKPESYLRRLYAETVLDSGVEQVWLSHWDNFFQPLGRVLKPLALSGWTIKRIKKFGTMHGQSVAELPFNKKIQL